MIDGLLALALTLAMNGGTGESTGGATQTPGSGGTTQAPGPGGTSASQGATQGQGATAGAGTSSAAPLSRDRRLATFALEAAERAAASAREATGRGDWAVARAHVDHLHEWLAIAARLERPTGEAAVRWDFAAREARRLDAALIARDRTAARWADAALALALADARAALAGAGGGGGPTRPAWDMDVVPEVGDPRRERDPQKKYEDVPLERERPWSRGRQW